MLFRSPTRKAPRGLAGSLLILALALGVTGCSEETADLLEDDSSSSAALLFRLPDFLGDVPCGASPGAMRSYVVTLVDRTAWDICGDGLCVPPETADSCARDCSDPAPCGDGVCASDEAAGTCPADCVCGDGLCVAPETAETCGRDCANNAPCGDGVCDEKGELGPEEETADLCPADCGALRTQFTLPSSIPVPCSQGVRFDNVAPSHRYSVQIDGYEAFSSELGPEGWADSATRFTALRSGSRHMVDAAGETVSPRWIGSCGEGEQERALVLQTGTSVVLHCDPIVDTAPASTQTSVVVDPQSALGSLHCVDPDKPGEPAVASFDILPQSGLPSVLGLPCGKTPVTQAYSGDNLVPGQTVDFFVAAHAEKDGDVVWGASCSALVKEGLTVNAACVPLSDRGTIRVDMAAVLAGAGFACGGDFASYDVELSGTDTAVEENGVPCEKPLSLGPLLPGDYDLQLAVRVDGGIELFSAACKATVEPGRTAVADCTPQ